MNFGGHRRWFVPREFIRRSLPFCSAVFHRQFLPHGIMESSTGPDDYGEAGKTASRVRIS
jgi:hypothetical protein